MKILIFEYINGGGFAGTELPASLAREGWLMLNAVLNDFIDSGKHELSVLLDQRYMNKIPQDIDVITVNSDDDVLAIFTQALENCDAVLPIAPETEQILWLLCTLVEKSGKRLLSSGSKAVVQTADKMTSFMMLSAHHIATIPSHRLDKYPHFYSQSTVIKVRDGVGCEQCFVCHNEDDFNRLLINLPHHEHYLIQPLISGMSLSISVLFKAGSGQLICINQQLITIHGQQFKLMGCEVNIAFDKTAFQTAVDKIAVAFPDLWGYVGIDLIKQNEQLLVVEINPRLTSSYIGIREALGINVAELILQLVDGEAKLIPTKNHIIHIDLA